MYLSKRLNMQLLKDNAGRIVAGLLVLILLGTSAYVSSIAGEVATKHDQAPTSHSPQFGLIERSIRANRTDIDILTERSEQRFNQVTQRLDLLQTEGRRREDKLDRILEKL